MRGNEGKREAGAVKGRRIGTTGRQHNPFAELSAAIIRQAAADDFEARKKRDTNKKWLRENCRAMENRKFYDRYQVWLVWRIGRANKAFTNALYEEDALKCLAYIREYCELDYDYSMKRRKWISRTITKMNAVVDAENRIKEIKDFFYSEWFIQLCDADGPLIYKQVVANYKLGRRPKGAD